MARTVIKICGLTRAEDGLAAIGAGADWLGLVRWPGSPRFRPFKACVEMVVRLRAEAPRPFEVIGVYVNPEESTLRDEIERLGLDRVQFHGEESPQRVGGCPLPAIKTVKVGSAGFHPSPEDYPGLLLLTDTAEASSPGGTGQSYDPGLLAELVRRRKVIVAGGLKPDNVGEVVRRLRPFGVDVASGVEAAPGLKDPERLKRFVQAIRQAESEPACR